MIIIIIIYIDSLKCHFYCSDWWLLTESIFAFSLQYIRIILNLVSLTLGFFSLTFQQTLGSFMMVAFRASCALPGRP
jgi:hypothetical protein